MKSALLRTEFSGLKTIVFSEIILRANLEEGDWDRDEREGEGGLDNTGEYLEPWKKKSGRDRKDEDLAWSHFFINFM